MTTTTRTNSPGRRGRHRTPSVSRGVSGRRPDTGGGSGPSKRSWLRRRRVKTPTILQMEAAECGAAALAMILAFYGRHLSLQHLRVLCGVSRDGSKASNLVKAARGLGLDAKGQQMSIQVLEMLTSPAIIFWEFNHYVVWEGAGRRFGKTVMYINDPAQGRRILTPEEFGGSFTGIVLTFRPNASFRRRGRPPRIFEDIPGRLRGTHGAMAIAMLSGLLLVGVSTILPAFTRGFIDTVLTGSGSPPLAAFFSLMAAAVLLTVLLTHLQQTHQLRVEMLLSTVSSARFLRHLLRLPVSFFNQRSPADIAQRLGINHRVAKAISQNFISAATNSSVAIMYALLMWSYNPTLAVLGMSISLLHVAVTRLIVRVRKDGVAKLRVDQAKLISTSYSGLRLIETMKATGSEAGFFRRWGDHQAALLNQQQTISVPSVLLSSVGPLLLTTNVAVILYFGGIQAVQGQISIGLLIAFQTILTTYNRPVTILLGLAPVFQDTAADIVRLNDVEETAQDAVFTRPEADHAKRLGGHLHFNAVTFGYGTLAKPLLNEFTFQVRPGHQVALVGGSGSGKSTVSRLIAGLYEPWSGVIEFDGRPHNTIPRSVLAASVAFVDQDIVLFAGTVRDNVTLRDPTITDDAVLAALRDACLDDVIGVRPGGIYSPVEQDGRNFSGGQRQRLEIARALVRNPSVLVLDEATSALDAETEQRISDNLRRRGCACVVIAHRLSTIRSSDEILVLDAGQVIERGTHLQLVAEGGAYAQLTKEI